MMDPLCPKHVGSTFKYFIILIVSTNYILGSLCLLLLQDTVLDRRMFYV